MSLENMKFIVKDVQIGVPEYWRVYPEHNTFCKEEAHIFTWNTLTDGDKESLKAEKKRRHIIPVGGLNAAH